ncbi:MAG TPA: histidine phosphatase family protein [Candidatus Atribacteria bacterium]|nr:histidine phosphatase family protein [Candidatus Atribacteria bacterium]HPT79461.1 histidine phosphatase family protein [Candidatus Atribacteria bacterium]
MRIYITRHGESEWNVSKRIQGAQNTRLTDKGIRQARALASRLQTEGISRIIASDLDRAYDTAVIVGQTLGIVPDKSEALREICLGVWEGLTRDDVEKLYPGQLKFWYSDCFFSPDSGESITEVRKRVSAFIGRLINTEENNERILLVTHAITAKILITELLKMPVEFIWCFRLDNTGISIIDVDGPRRTVSCLNDSCHIAK